MSLSRKEPIRGLRIKLLRPRRQRERYKTIGFNEKTKAIHVCLKFWYISSPYSAKQKRGMTKFKVLWRMRARDGSFSILCINSSRELRNGSR